MNIFVTATDTDAGKTFFCALLIRALRASGVDAVGFKPIACGDWGDVDALCAAANGIEPREAVCALHLEMPASPLTAATAAGLQINPKKIIEAYRDLAARHEVVVVEGVGGWLVPITSQYSVADFVADLDLPVLLVVRNRIGALNHTLLTLQAMERGARNCVGIVLNHVGISAEPAAHSNRATLEMLRTVPVLAEIEQDQAGLDVSPFLTILTGGPGAQRISRGK